MSSSLSVVWMSRRSGTLVYVTGSLSRMEANRMGRAAFLEPLTSMLPVSGTPPSMTSLSIILQGAVGTGNAGAVRDGGNAVSVDFFLKKIQSRPLEKLLAKRSVSAYRNLPVAEVAQLVEHLVVAQVAVGSSPIFRPINLPRVR